MCVLIDTHAQRRMTAVFCNQKSFYNSCVCADKYLRAENTWELFRRLENISLVRVCVLKCTYTQRTFDDDFDRFLDVVAFSEEDVEKVEDSDGGQQAPDSSGMGGCVDKVDGMQERGDYLKKRNDRGSKGVNHILMYPVVATPLFGILVAALSLFFRKREFTLIQAFISAETHRMRLAAFLHASCLWCIHVMLYPEVVRHEEVAPTPMRSPVESRRSFL